MTPGPGDYISSNGIERSLGIMGKGKKVFFLEEIAKRNASPGPAKYDYGSKGMVNKIMYF